MKQEFSITMRIDNALKDAVEEKMRTTGFERSVILRAILTDALNVLTDEDVTRLIVDLTKYGAVKDRINESDNHA